MLQEIDAVPPVGKLPTLRLTGAKRIAMNDAHMSNYRRKRVPGGTYFFTVNLADPQDCTLCMEVDLLRECYRKTQLERPFYTDAIVVLPNHIHAIWTLPPGDDDYSDRWRRIKGRFSCALEHKGIRSWSKLAKREHGIWQRRFWEHSIRDPADFERHLAYCWLDPMRHALVDDPKDWAFSSLNKRGETPPPNVIFDADALRESMGEIGQASPAPLVPQNRLHPSAA